MEVRNMFVGASTMFVVDDCEAGRLVSSEKVWAGSSREVTDVDSMAVVGIVQVSGVAKCCVLND